MTASDHATKPSENTLRERGERRRPRLCDRRHERSRPDRRRALLPGLRQIPEVKADELATTVSNVDLVNYILSNFKTVDEVREAMPKIRVVRNAEIEKEFGTPLPLHHIVSDATGASIVIEYMDGQLSVTDNKVGAMTNSPGYDWHLLNLRNYANLTPQAARPHSIDGVSLAPFGAGSGMLGLPGGFTPPSRLGGAD